MEQLCKLHDSCFMNSPVNEMKFEETVAQWGTGGRKDDGDKSRVELLDAEFLEDVGRVLAFGARKYAAHNWRGGLSWSRILGAILRHTLAILRGEDRDSESNLPHSAHLGCNVMFLHWMMKHKPELDDRWKA